jgi:hypothetical protein
MDSQLGTIYQNLISFILADKPVSNTAWGIWVRQYPAIPDKSDAVDFLAFPDKVWFVEGLKVRQENSWKWMRLVAAVRLAPSPCRDMFFSIGQTAFAPYEGSDDYYVEVLWGGRWGEAWRVGISPEGKFVVKAGLWKA